MFLFRLVVVRRPTFHAFQHINRETNKQLQHIVRNNQKQPAFLHQKSFQVNISISRRFSCMFILFFRIAFAVLFVISVLGGVYCIQ